MFSRWYISDLFDLHPNPDGRIKWKSTNRKLKDQPITKDHGIIRWSKPYKVENQLCLGKGQKNVHIFLSMYIHHVKKNYCDLSLFDFFCSLRPPLRLSRGWIKFKKPFPFFLPLFSHFLHMKWDPIILSTSRWASWKEWKYQLFEWVFARQDLGKLSPY